MNKFKKFWNTTIELKLPTFILLSGTSTSWALVFLYLLLGSANNEFFTTLSFNTYHEAELEAIILFLVIAFNIYLIANLKFLITEKKKM